MPHILLYVKPVCLHMFICVYICTYTYNIGADAGILCEQIRVMEQDSMVVSNMIEEVMNINFIKKGEKILK